MYPVAETLQSHRCGAGVRTRPVAGVRVESVAVRPDPNEGIRFFVADESVGIAVKQGPVQFQWCSSASLDDPRRFGPVEGMVWIRDFHPHATSDELIGKISERIMDRGSVARHALYRVFSDHGADLLPIGEQPDLVGLE